MTAVSTRPSRLAGLQRFTYLLVIPMMVVMPAYIAIGRSFFGVGGWGTLVLAFMVAPVVFVVAVMIAILVIVRGRTAGTRDSGPVTAVLLLPHWIFGLIAPLGLGDAGDTLPAVPSVLEMAGFTEQMANFVLEVASIGFVVAGVGALVAAIIELGRAASDNRQPAGAPTDAPALS